MTRTFMIGIPPRPIVCRFAWCLVLSIPHRMLRAMQERMLFVFGDRPWYWHHNFWYYIGPFCVQTCSRGVRTRT